DRQWQSGHFMEAFESVPNLLDLVKNPFLLTLTLTALPDVVSPDRLQDLKQVKITRVALYDHFLVEWIRRGKTRLVNHELSAESKNAFKKLSDDFEKNCTSFLKKIVRSIYKEQSGRPVVDYQLSSDRGT